MLHGKKINLPPATHNEFVFIEVERVEDFGELVGNLSDIIEVPFIVVGVSEEEALLSRQKFIGNAFGFISIFCGKNPFAILNEFFDLTLVDYNFRAIFFVIEIRKQEIHLAEIGYIRIESVIAIIQFPSKFNSIALELCLHSVCDFFGQIKAI